MIMAAVIPLFFSLVWAWSRKLDNYSWVDAAWAFGIGLTALTWLFPLSSPKHLIAALLVGFWSLRLSHHLQKRIRKHHPEEDARYQKLREIWHGRISSAFFWFFQAQAISVLLLTLPFFFIARDFSHWGFWESIGLTVTLTGIIGETLSDHQISQFKKSNSNPKAVCKNGLWRYSRHPNYFFESIIWFGFYLFACGSAYGWATIHAPAIVTFLLLKVTGIPPTEASAVRRKGETYLDYQRTTSPFIPLPPKQS